MIEVLPVNKSTWVKFYVRKGFSLALNSSNLKYNVATDTSELIELPDGIYEIKQSFKPNIHTLQHYLHMRTTALERKIRLEFKKLKTQECKLTREEVVKNTNDLREIQEYMLAAKFAVEECHDKKEGIELYKWAEKLLEYYTNECQC